LTSSVRPLAQDIAITISYLLFGLPLVVAIYLEDGAAASFVDQIADANVPEMERS
jgi:hypothetical protein